MRVVKKIAQLTRNHRSIANHFTCARNMCAIRNCSIAVVPMLFCRVYKIPVSRREDLKLLVKKYRFANWRHK